MIRGENVVLRLIQEDDLERMYAFHEDISNRGDFFPTGIASSVAFRNAFQESGFWGEKKGMLIIADREGAILGHIEYFETVSYLDEVELSYILYSPEVRGRGIASESVVLLTRYLFDRRKLNRIRLVIHPGNTASKRVAEKSGYTFEGVARGAWYHRGRNHDVEIWSVLRDEHYARTSDPNRSEAP